MNAVKPCHARGAAAAGVNRRGHFITSRGKTGGKIIHNRRLRRAVRKAPLRRLMNNFGKGISAVECGDLSPLCGGADLSARGVRGCLWPPASLQKPRRCGSTISSAAERVRQPAAGCPKGGAACKPPRPKAPKPFHKVPTSMFSRRFTSDPRCHCAFQLDAAFFP